MKIFQKVFENSVFSNTGVCVLYKDFKCSHTVVEDLPFSILESAANTEGNVNKVKEIVLEKHYISLRELTNEFNFGYRTAQYIVVDNLGMRRVAARFIPKDVIFVQSHHLKMLAEDLISEVKIDPTLME